MMHLITGNTGAGKSTYAISLKDKTKGVIFSVDHWNKVLFMPDKKETDGVDWFLERIARSDKMIQSLVLQLSAIKVPVILDLGFAKQKRRALFYAFAKANKIPYQLHYLDVNNHTRLQRVIHRNEKQGETFQFEVTKEMFEFMETWFEKPTATELENAIITT